MVVLRETVLRHPLGRVFKPEELEKDSHYIHLAGFNAQNDMVATTLLHGQSDAMVRFRQVAVAEASRGQGVGKAMIAFAEKTARAMGFSEAILYARAEAVPFYRHIGYEEEGEYFEEIGLPHIMMWKAL